MNAVSLSWKNFSVDLEKAKGPFATILGEDYDGMVGSTEQLLVISKNPISEEATTAIQTWWENALPTAFAPTVEEVIAAKIYSAAEFGATIVFQAKVGNVAQGITQAGKTKEVSDFLRSIARYLNEGSLYAAIAAIDDLIDAEIPIDIQPFVTVARLTDTKHKVQDFLGIPRT
jgi:hypothetical protein